MNWFWSNSVKVEFGADCVKENLKKYIKPMSKVICIYGDDSINNDCRADIELILNDFRCTYIWEGGVSHNTKFERLIEISKFVASETPDLILAVGGQYVIDNTKFISCAANLPEGTDAWEEILVKGQFPDEYSPFGAIITVPGCGSEWNSRFTITKESIKIRLTRKNDNVYPLFSLIDPKYSMSISLTVLRNVLFESIVNIIDQCFIPIYESLTDEFFLDTMKELIEIAPNILSKDEKKSSIKLYERLIAASLFSNNSIFSIGKECCWGIHIIGNQLSTFYNIDYASAFSIICPFFLENQFRTRITILAKAAMKVFHFYDGTDELKARFFINELRKFINLLNLPEKITDCNGVKINENDIEVVTKNIMKSTQNKNFGFRNQIAEEDVKSILKKVIF